MGMFDEITYEAPCPWCGATITGWQSKDGECELSTLTPQELHEEAHGPEGTDPITFYTGCRECGSWVDIKTRPALVYDRATNSPRRKHSPKGTK